MPSSTSSFERPIPVRGWRTPVVLAAVLTLIGVFAWELHSRSAGFAPATQNTNDLWAQARRRVDDEPRATVIIGSSRILFDVDIHVWQQTLGGPKPIQLALEGTSPRTFLSDLAQDPDFDGFLIVGVTPGLFFDEPGGVRLDALERYRNQTPAQRLGQWLGARLERGVAFMDADTRLFTQIERLAWPTTRGMRPPLQLPRKLMNMQEDRNAEMWSRLDTDPEYRQLARDIWAGFWAIPSPPPDDARADEVVETTRREVEMIRARGGEVIFVRCPSGGGYGPREAERQPRARFWDRLIAEVPAVGVHFADHETLQGFELPEWSHLSSRHQDEFTRALAEIVRPSYETWMP